MPHIDNVFFLSQLFGGQYTDYLLAVFDGVEQGISHFYLLEEGTELVCIPADGGHLTAFYQGGALDVDGPVAFGAKFQQCIRRAVFVHTLLGKSFSYKGKTNNLAVRWMFDGLFREYGVDLVLQGHEHNYARMTNKNDEGEMTTPLYLVSHASPKSYRLSFNDKYDRFGTDRRFYQHIDVTGDTLRMQAYLENDSLYDDVRIVKNASGTQIIDNAKDIPEILEMPARLSGKKAEEFERNAEKWRNRSLVK